MTTAAATGPARDRGVLHLTAVLDAAVAGDGPRALDARFWVHLATLADRVGLDLIELVDAFGPPAAPGSARPDAAVLAARLGPAVATTALGATITTTHTEPFAVAKAVQTLDWITSGRAAWTVEVSRTPEEAALTGRRGVAGDADLWAEAADVIDVARHLWDSWEDDAIIRDVAAGRFVDRDKLHYVDFEGRWFSVKGPSIVPRSPQGLPPVVVATHRGGEREVHAEAVAVAHADVLRIGGADVDAVLEAAGALLARVAAAGRDPAEVRVLGEIPLGDGGARRTGSGEEQAAILARGAGIVDGWALRPTRLPADLTALAEATVPALDALGLRAAAPPGITLRARLGLDRPPSRYAADPATPVAHQDVP